MTSEGTYQDWSGGKGNGHFRQNCFWLSRCNCPRKNAEPDELAKRYAEMTAAKA